MAKKIPLEIVLLAGGYKASREGKDRIIATNEMIEALPKMGYEIVRGKKIDPLERTQPFEPLSVM